MFKSVTYQIYYVIAYCAFLKRSFTRSPRMNKRLVFGLATYSGLSVASFYTGVVYERNRFVDKLNETTNPFILNARDELKHVSSAHVTLYLKFSLKI